MNFLVLEEYKDILEESEDQKKYLDFVKEVKKLASMKMILIPMIIGMLGTVPQNLAKKMKESEMRKRIKLDD